MTLSGMKVFSVTKAKEREELGTKVTAWLRDNQKKYNVINKVVRQSSDREFHCLSIILFFVER